MKNIMGVIVVILLFIVPFGSWYYLQSGLDYRKDALKQLQPKEDVTSFIGDPSFLAGRTTLIQFRDINEAVLPEYFDQYKESHTFLLVSNQSPSIIDKRWKQMDAFMSASFKNHYQDAAMVLVDTSMMVRNIYTSSPQDITKMIEHTAIILPRVKEVDIKMKK